MTNNSNHFKQVRDTAQKTALPYDQLMTLFQISHRMNQITNLQKLLEEILRSAITNLGAERGMIILTDESGESYRTVASESLKKEDIAFSTSIVTASLEQKKTLLSSDLRSDSQFKDAESVKALRILSFICVPLIVTGQNKPVGTLYVDHRLSVKPFSQEDAAFLEALANIAAIAITNANLMEQLVGENIQLREEVGKKYEFPGVVGKSDAMQKIFREIKQVVNDDCTVLISGESGSGKEVIAKAIHYNGNRKNKPFLAINCGALPETILEAELFGSVRGAYTGAIDKPGLLHAAQGGTVFLDEIHHTSEAIQVKLLRFLQNKETRRVGGTKSIKVDVRLICASNENLQEAINNGKFRKDFFYRINVVSINVPPLREHKEDIPLLAEYFLQRYCKEKSKKCLGFNAETLKALCDYDWGENNIRELENEIARVAIFVADDSAVKIDNLSDKIRNHVRYKHGMTAFASTTQTGSLSFEEFEKEYIKSILSKTRGNKAKAARIMRIPRSTLIGKMRRLGLL